MSASKSLETVDQTKFKKRMKNNGVDNLQDALNILNLFQEYRTGFCVLSMDELGIAPHMITAAIHYILQHHNAAGHLYRCHLCQYCKDDRCARSTNTCNFKEIEHASPEI
jgi:hypothetical protein